MKYKFKKYYFVDLNNNACSAIDSRLTSKGINKDIICDDCNKAVDRIVAEIPKKSLSLAFIDPTALDFKFEALKKLSTRKMDLIINYPDGTAIKRGIDAYYKGKSQKLDEFVGGQGWKAEYEKKGFIGIIDYYIDNIREIGYKCIDAVDTVPIKSTDKNLALYRLLFASKHPTGKKFWKEAIKKDEMGQMTLEFGEEDETNN